MARAGPLGPHRRGSTTIRSIAKIYLSLGPEGLSTWIMSNPALPRGGAITRRQFIRYTALAAGATALTGYARPKPRLVSANEKLNIAVIGCGGKGRSDLQFCGGENIVALCDVVESDDVAAARKN